MVKEICRRESITAVLSFFDPDVVTLANHFDEFLEMGIIPIIPRGEIAEICFDKYKTYQYLCDHHFDTPRTYIKLEEARNDLQSGQLQYPLFVKPRCGFGSHLTFKACNDLELNAFFNYAADMIIQEEIRGDAFDFDILNDRNGRVISVVPWRKFSSRLGETEQSQTFYDQNVINFGVRLGATLGHIGPLDADIFLNGEKITVLEINLRFGGGYPVAHLAGADFPAKILKMIQGEDVVPDIGNFETGTVMMKDLLVIGGPETYFSENRLINLRD